jgi:hypothetical protein
MPQIDVRSGGGGNEVAKPRKKPPDEGGLVNFGGAAQSRTGLTGFAIRGITALLPRRRDFTQIRSRKKGSAGLPFFRTGAGEEARTLDLNLGKVALYQLSYSRI